MTHAANLMILALLALCQLGCQGTQSGPSTPSYFYGEKFPNSGGIWRIDELKGGEEFIIVEGTIKEVCKTMGCWMTLRDDHGHELFVLLKDHAFFVPRNAAGRPARVWGRTERAEVSVDQLQHFAMDAGRSAQEIAAIDKPIERITFHADSVIIQGDGLEPAEPPVVR